MFAEVHTKSVLFLLRCDILFLHDFIVPLNGLLLIKFLEINNQVLDVVCLAIKHLPLAVDFLGNAELIQAFE
jgi:hypothetical protein